MHIVFKFSVDNYQEDEKTRSARAFLRMKDSKKMQTCSEADRRLMYCGENFTNPSHPAQVCIKKLVRYIDVTFSPVPGMVCHDLNARTGCHPNILRWIRDISLFVPDDDRSIFLGIVRFVEDTNDYCPGVVPWYKFLSDVDHQYIQCSTDGCRFLKRRRPFAHYILCYQLKELLDRELCQDLTERIQSFLD